MRSREAAAKPIHDREDRRRDGNRSSASRREFLTRIPGAAALTAAAAAVPLGSPAQAGRGASDGPNGSANPGGSERAAQSFRNRERAAREEADLPIPKQVANGDEQRYPNLIGNYSKGLPHNSIGEVDRLAYRVLLQAVSQGTAAAFERVPLGAATDAVTLVNPLAGLAYDLEGTDSHQLAIPPFPSLSSKALADQAVELYWMALCRDVNFTDYATSPLALAAAAELSSLTAFAGPKSGGRVTPQTLFRGLPAGNLIGPFVSQMALKPFNYGPYAMTGQITTCVPGIDYMTTQKDWLACQNGQGPFAANMLDPQPRHIRNGRDWTNFVHVDPNAGLLVEFYNAGIWLFEQGAPLNPGNPYTRYRKQSAFATFGVPHFLGLLGEAKQRACKAAWYAKWFVHRALRPEEYGGLAHMTRTGQAAYPLDRDIFNSAALARVHGAFGSYLLPQAFPEGCPQHPSYPQGHASMAGACATILKAAFDGDTRFDTLADGDIVTASEDGLALVPYAGGNSYRITVGGEIDKLAANIAQARNFSGIHWRSDCDWGLRLGEAVALSILADQRNNYAGEDFEGFTITRFDGTPVTV